MESFCRWGRGLFSSSIEILRTCSSRISNGLAFEIIKMISATCLEQAQPADGPVERVELRKGLVSRGEAFSATGKALYSFQSTGDWEARFQKEKKLLSRVEAFHSKHCSCSDWNCFERTILPESDERLKPFLRGASWLPPQTLKLLEGLFSILPGCDQEIYDCYLSNILLLTSRFQIFPHTKSC
jgi:hypothetical protein